MMPDGADAAQARDVVQGHSTKHALRAAIGEAIVVVLMGIVVGLFGVSEPLNPFDEANVLVGAERINAGDLPFRDFYAVYPPAQYYVLAGLFSIFGVKAITLRVYCIVLRALVALVIYRTTRQLAGRAMGAACWCASMLWLTASGFYGYPTFPALLLAWTGLAMLLGCVKKAQTNGCASIRHLSTWMFAAGAAAGAAALFRHDLAFYAVLASLPSLLVLLQSPVRPGERAESRTVARLLRAWPYATGMTLAFAGPTAQLLSRVPIDEVVLELFSYPITGYAQARGLPYPPLLAGPLSFGLLLHPRSLAKTLENVCFYAPLVFDAAAIVWFAARVRRDRAFVANADGLALASMALLSALFFNLGRVRSDPIHIVAMVLPSLVVAAALIHRASIVRHIVARGAAVAMAGLFLLMLASPVLAFPRPSWSEIAQVLFATPQAGRERISHLDTGAPRDAVAAYLRSEVPPEGRVFVAAGRHDRIWVNETILYFLSARLPGAKYHLFDPGVATTLRAQREIVEGLERYRVDYVAVSTAYDESPEPNLSSRGGGSSYLDEYLQRNYLEAYRASPSLSVWRRSTGWNR